MLGSLEEKDTEGQASNKLFEVFQLGTFDSRILCRALRVNNQFNQFEDFHFRLFTLLQFNILQNHLMAITKFWRKRFLIDFFCCKQNS